MLGSSMYIRHVRIEGIRCFGSGAQSVDLDLCRPDGTFAGWTVIAGRNGAGKTTFLRAIALAVAGHYVAATLQESFIDWRRRGDEKGKVELTLIPDARDDNGEQGPHSPRRVSLTWQNQLPDEPDEPRIFNSYADSNGIWAIGDVASYGPWITQPRGWFIAGYGPFRRLTGETSDAKRLRSTRSHTARLLSLFREDASLGDCIEWLKEVNHRKLENDAAARELEEGILRLLDDGLLPDGARVRKVDSRGLWVEQNGLSLPVLELSDGYRAVVGLILDIARHMHECYGELPLSAHNGRIAVDLPGVVLIDEVDAHLHVSWQQRIGFWLKERFPRVQFIVSTHSPFICQAADPRGLIRLPAPGEERIAEHVPDTLYRKVVNGTVDDAVLSDLFGLEHTRSEVAEEKVSEFSRLEVAVLRGSASAEDESRYQQLKSELPLGPSHEVELVLRRLEQTLPALSTGNEETSQ